MEKLFIVLTILVATAGCSIANGELYKATDSFIESLSTTYDRYPILGGSNYSKTTSDGKYLITPVGRLIVVKIQRSGGKEEYEKLKKSIERYYKNNTRVNNVFLNESGTVSIDCRR